MSDPDLLQATASEPLTLGEEYANQLSWSQDPLKWTFILLAPGVGEGEGEGLPADRALGGAMVGDVNLFLHEADAMDWMRERPPPSAGGGEVPELEELDDFTYPTPGPVPKVGELEIMVAVPSARRRGLATLAIQAMIHYAWKHLGLCHFFAQVQQDNAASIALFRGLGFRMHRPGPNVFGEVVLIRSLAGAGAGAGVDGMVGPPFDYALGPYPPAPEAGT